MTEEADDEFKNELKTMVASLMTTVEELKENYNSIKQDVLETIPILRDFKGLLQRKPLFERSTFTYLNPLAKEIKAEIMREVSSKLIGPTEELKALKSEVSIALEELTEKTLEFKSVIEDLKQENIDSKKDNETIHENVDILQRNIDDAREDLLLKAPYHEITKLVEKLATKATNEDVKTLREKIQECPSTEQVEKLYKQLEILNQQMISLASKDMVKEMEQGLLVNVDNKFEQYVSASNLQDEVDKILSRIRDTNNTFDFFKISQEKQTVFTKRELEKIQRLLQSRPWIKDIEIVSTFIDDKINSKDFEKFKKDVLPQIQFFDEKVNLFSKRIESFDRVLERYDEIILDKASKDDVSEIKELLPKLLMAVDFDAFKEMDTKQKEILDEKVRLSQTSAKLIDGKIEKFQNSYKNFKGQFKDFNTKYNSVKELSYQLESKADKSDIYAMFDYTARREEVKLTTQAMEILHKQVEMIVMFMLVTIKTMLKNNDSAALKNRQRNEIFTNVSALMEWISHSIPPEVDKMLDSARSVLTVSHRKMPQENEESQEHMLPILSNHRKYKRHAISLTPAPDTKSFVDMPYW